MLEDQKPNPIKDYPIYKKIGDYIVDIKPKMRL